MKKFFLMLCFAFTTILVEAQESYNSWKAHYCNERDVVCRERYRQYKVEFLRKQDSIKNAHQADIDRRKRAQWEADKERRDKLTPEERQKEDEKRRLDYETNKKKKSEDGYEAFLCLNTSTKTGDAPDYNNVLGGQAGVEIPFVRLSDYLGLRVGVAYSMQGGKYDSHDYIPGGNYSNSSRTSRLNYINFPIMVRHQMARNGFFAEAGLQPGILVSAKDKGSTTRDIKDELNKFDVGIPIGIGYQLKNKIGVGLRLTPGLMNVNKDKEFKNRNMVASLRASYTL